MLNVKITPGRGRGIFAGKHFRRGEVIESCPVIALDPGDTELLKNTILCQYFFKWGPGSKGAAICLGFGSLYNHSVRPNAKYLKDVEAKRITFKAIRDIREGEEILVSYAWVAGEKTPQWFTNS